MTFWRTDIHLSNSHQTFRADSPCRDHEIVFFLPTPTPHIKEKENPLAARFVTPSFPLYST